MDALRKQLLHIRQQIDEVRRLRSKFTPQEDPIVKILDDMHAAQVLTMNAIDRIERAAGDALRQSKDALDADRARGMSQ